MHGGKGALFGILIAGMLSGLVWADVVLDDFDNFFGDEPAQNAIGAEYGLKKFGKDKIDEGGGYWYTFADDSGSAVTNAKGEKITDKNTNSMVADGVMQVTFTTGKDILYAYAQVETPLALKPSSDNTEKDTVWFNLEKFEKIGLRVKGKGRVRFELATADIDSLPESDRWGYYGFNQTLVEGDWQEVEIEKSKFLPAPDSKPKELNWTWDHGKAKVKRFGFSIIDDGIKGTAETASVVLDKIVLYGINYKEVFDFEHPINNVIVPKNQASRLAIGMERQGLIRIGYTIDNAGPVSLAVYDMHGRNCGSLIEETQGAGKHSIVFDPRQRGLLSGTYLLLFSHGGLTTTSRFIITR